MRSENTEHTDKIALSDEAIGWLVKLHSGVATPVDHDAFADWRTLSDQHEAAARDAEAVWSGIGVAGPQFRRKNRELTVTRRAALCGGIFLLAGVVLQRTGFIGPQLFADYVTGIGEQRTIALADGSSVSLNADTALSVDMRPEKRSLQLFYGQATFDVAPDRARPFVVSAAAGKIEAIGTSFDIDIRTENVAVTVLSGLVEVSTDADPITAVEVSGNERVLYDRAGSAFSPEVVDADIETSWRRGRLIFNQRKLGDVISELERYRRGKIVIANNELRALNVTGAFDLTAPETILDTLASTLPIRITHLPLVTIIR
ncbi:FecR family protein [Brucella sp. BE17]|uniref:FecR family protein n=1 Tax=Brucella sp. BE17 TaxID=3142977 RepID=UPI0031BA4C3E